MVKSEEIYAPQNYVGAITGNYFIPHFNGSIECIRKQLNKYGFDNLWDYPLTEIKHIVKNCEEYMYIIYHKYEFYYK